MSLSKIDTEDVNFFNPRNSSIFLYTVCGEMTIIPSSSSSPPVASTQRVVGQPLTVSAVAPLVPVCLMCGRRRPSSHASPATVRQKDASERVWREQARRVHGGASELSCPWLTDCLEVGERTFSGPATEVGRRGQRRARGPVGSTSVSKN